MATQSESAQLIKALVSQYRKLLEEHWVELWASRNGAEDARGSVAFRIGPNVRAYKLASSLSFAMRSKHGLKEDFTPTPPPRDCRASELGVCNFRSSLAESYLSEAAKNL
jgi:hypothetical protein